MITPVFFKAGINRLGGREEYNGIVQLSTDDYVEAGDFLGGGSEKSRPFLRIKIPFRGLIFDLFFCYREYRKEPGLCP